MKKNYLLLLTFAVTLLHAQSSNLYYSGKFLNHKGKPQNFLKIYNKNSGIYELTDADGIAIIAAKPYDTLVWNQGENTEVVADICSVNHIIMQRRVFFIFYFQKLLKIQKIQLYLYQKFKVKKK